jgi:hypothetical protein
VETTSDNTVVVIPGPLRSFLRMAGISQKISQDEVASLLARNVVMLGYGGAQGRGGRTEFLVLLMRYVDQARELQVLAGKEGVLHADSCEQAKPLLKTLGYRARPDCGKPGSWLETADAQRAFLTIDSGFPLPELEKDLTEGKPFSYAFPETRVPALKLETEKSEKDKNKAYLDELLSDPGLARLYWALGRMDPETQELLRQPRVVKRIVPFSGALDFYGSQIRVRSGRVMVPGGSSAEPAWKEIVGASADQPEEFIVHLLSKDNGWTAAYFDSLARVNPTQQAHFTEAQRLKHFYEALRGKAGTPDAVTGVFRRDSELLLLLTQLTWEPNGQPHVPGSLDAWKKVVWQKVDSNIGREWKKRTRHADNAEQMVEALFALARMQTEAGPLQAYLMACDLDNRRARDHQLSAETVTLLARKFSDLSGQYQIFSEFPELNNASIMSFLHEVIALDSISNSGVRGNAMGIFQANVGLWQIFARQGEIPSADLNGSWERMIKAFGKPTTAVQVFDGGRDSVRELLRASTGRPEGSQDEIIAMLAGPRQATPEGRQVHEAVGNRIHSIMDEQRLVSLDTLLNLGDGLQDVAHVKQSGNSLLPLAGELREFEMPQPIFKSREREEWAAGIYDNRHTDQQMRTDLTKTIKSATTPQQLADARGQLAPFLRDTLVGLNYAYYEPPAAQILHHNPLFVRSHDFSGDTVIGMDKVWQPSQLFGVGSPAGGGAHLVGSLADLPYVLATVEQDFIAPENVQALIWREVVAGLLTNAVVPRWWGVSRNELHAVALHQEAGEELLASAAKDEQLRKKVLDILSTRMAARMAGRVEQQLKSGQVGELTTTLTPADTFYLAAEYRRKYPGEISGFGASGQELQSLCQKYPEELSWERMSRDFGVPHPVLGQSYGRELMNMAPLPAYMGYSSRLLAESWDSNNLYWARLADEKGYPPVMLNRLVPELTRNMIGKIFATDFEDWPALLRAARETGEEFRQGKIAAQVSSGAAPKP